MVYNQIPIISVVLPVYSGMEFLKISVESVLNQKTENFNFEFLICDDCSRDDSYEYLKSIDDPRVKLYQNQSNKGLFPTLNFLIQKTSTDLIHLWAQDDIMLPHCLLKTLEFHREFPNVNFSFSRLQHIDEKGNLLEKPIVFSNRTISVQDHALSSVLYGSIAGNIANICVVKSAIEKVGYFDDSLKYVGDFKMWCLLSKNKPVGMNGSILVHVRRHSGQLSKNIDASYNKLKENHSVYQCFLDTLNLDFKNPAKKILKWKIYPMYFNQYLFILSKKKFKLSAKYLRFLNNYESIPILGYRWFIIKILTILNLDRRFYNFLFFKEIEQIKLKHKELEL